MSRKAAKEIHVYLDDESKFDFPYKYLYAVDVISETVSEIKKEDKKITTFEFDLPDVPRIFLEDVVKWEDFLDSEAVSESAVNGFFEKLRTERGFTLENLRDYVQLGEDLGVDMGEENEGAPYVFSNELKKYIASLGRSSPRRSPGKTKSSPKTVPTENVLLEVTDASGKLIEMKMPRAYLKYFGTFKLMFEDIPEEFENEAIPTNVDKVFIEDVIDYIENVLVPVEEGKSVEVLEFDQRHWNDVYVLPGKIEDIVIKRKMTGKDILNYVQAAENLGIGEKNDPYSFSGNLQKYLLWKFVTPVLIKERKQKEKSPNKPMNLQPIRDIFGLPDDLSTEEKLEIEKGTEKITALLLDM